MNWSLVLRRHGCVHEERSGIEPDPFQLLHAKGEANVPIGFTIKTSHPDYGAVSCQMHITIHCPQDEQSINLAAEVCFRKAVELFNCAAPAIGAPAVPPLPAPE